VLRRRKQAQDPSVHHKVRSQGGLERSNKKKRNDKGSRRFTRAEPAATGAFVTQPQGSLSSGLERSDKKPMLRIHLIDWTSARTRTSLDYAKPLAYLSFLCLPGLQISLDAFSVNHAQI
jgi:hypothetical protein